MIKSPLLKQLIGIYSLTYFISISVLFFILFTLFYTHIFNHNKTTLLNITQKLGYEASLYFDAKANDLKPFELEHALRTISTSELNLISYFYMVNETPERNIYFHNFSPVIDISIEKFNRQNTTSTISFNELTSDSYGTVYQYSYPVLFGSLGTIYIGMSKDSIKSKFYKIVYITYAIIFIIYFLGLFLFYYFISRFLKPIYLLTRYAKALSSSTYETPIPLQSTVVKDIAKVGEIGILKDTLIHLENKTIDQFHHLKTSIAQNKKIESELEIAHRLQHNMLPSPSSLSHGLFDLHFFLKSTSQVGGDFYDFYLKHDHYLYFFIGDVCGKGVSAALFMSQCMSFLKVIIQHFDSTADIVTLLNQYISNRNDDDYFITLFLGCIHFETNTLHFVNAGHTAPLLIKSDTVSFLPKSNFVPIGINSDHIYQSSKMSLDPDDKLFLFTDGLCDVSSDSGALYTTTQLQDHLLKSSSISTDLFMDKFSNHVSTYLSIHNQVDDITFGLLHWKGVSNEPSFTTDLRVYFFNELEELNKLYQITTQFITKNKLSTQLGININLVLEEIVSNIIFYAYKDHDLHKIFVRYQLKDASLYVTIEDDGFAFNPLEKPILDVPDSIEDVQVGGLGLHLIKKLADSLDYKREDSKNILSLSFLINQPD